MNNLQVLLHSHCTLYFHLILADLTFILWRSQQLYCAGDQNRNPYLVYCAGDQMVNQERKKGLEMVFQSPFVLGLELILAVNKPNYHQSIHAAFQKISTKVI